MQHWGLRLEQKLVLEDKVYLVRTGCNVGISLVGRTTSIGSTSVIEWRSVDSITG